MRFIFDTPQLFRLHARLPTKPQVHRIRPRSRMRDDAEPNLITLCACCRQDALEEEEAQNSAETSVPWSLCKGSEQGKAIEGSRARRRG